MHEEYVDLARRFKENPMLAREFLDIHRSFSPWQKFMIRLRYFMSRIRIRPSRA
jgi:hypothetical protein